VLSTLRNHANVAGEYSLFDVANISSAFIGVCVSPQCIVLEYGGGSIEKRYQKMELSRQEILRMCRDTAAGMAHLVPVQ
jgi:anthranilate/para-aminobenzoate synthase component II